MPTREELALTLINAMRVTMKMEPMTDNDVYITDGWFAVADAALAALAALKGPRTGGSCTPPSAMRSRAWV